MPRTILVKRVWGKAGMFRLAEETELLGVFKFISDELDPKVAAIIQTRMDPGVYEHVVIATGKCIRKNKTDVGEKTYYVAIFNKNKNQYVIQGRSVAGAVARMVIDASGVPRA